MSNDQKITLGQLRDSGSRRLQLLCRESRCAHSIKIVGLLAGDPTAVLSGIHVCLPGLRSSRSRSQATHPTPKGLLRE